MADNNPNSSSALILQAIAKASQKADGSAQAAQDTIQQSLCPTCNQPINQDPNVQPKP